LHWVSRTKTCWYSKKAPDGPIHFKIETHRPLVSKGCLKMLR
jgi:hypothetical protein